MQVHFPKGNMAPTGSALSTYQYLVILTFFPVGTPESVNLKIKQHNHIFPNSQNTSSFAPSIHLHMWISLPSTYSITMQRWRRVSKEQNMDTTKGFSAKVRMSLSTKACWIWFLKIRFCLLIFFMANRWWVSRWRTRYTALVQIQKQTCPHYCYIWSQCCF